MNHGHFSKIGASTLLLIVPLVGCSSYVADPPGGAGGQTGSGGAGETGGAASGGAASGGAGTGGDASTGGTGAGSGGDTGTGGREIAPDAACEDVTPCGGEVAGVWFAPSSCLPVSGIANLGDLGIGCNEGDISGKIDVTGNLTIMEDGTISDNTNTTAELFIELQPECLDVSGTVTTCDRIGIPLASAGFDDVTCVDSENTAGGCTCTGTVNQTGGMGYVLGFNAETTGTYVSADNTLTVTGTGPEDLAYAYCAEGNFIMATPTTMTNLGVTNGEIVLQKQPQ